MRIALVKIGEPLPGEGPRPRRMTRLAIALAAKGHEVVWWTSDWSHQGKVTRAAALTEPARKLGFEVRMLHAPPYRSNVSLGRISHHEVFAKKLIEALEATPRPDVLWVCFPAIAHTLRLATWAKTHGVSLIFDIRDLSPDVFATLAPKPLRPLTRFALSPLARRVGRAFSQADGLVAASAGYLGWGEMLAGRAGRLPPKREVFALGYDLPEVSPVRAREIAAILAAKGVKSTGRLRAVFAGTFGTSYDIGTLIAASRLADQRNIAVDFVLAGGGDATPTVETAARQIDRLIYVGWLDADSLQMLLASADAGLMAYAQGATQGLPNKLFEYMANGLAILNSLGGETAALVAAKGIGVTYEAGSPEALLGAIGELASDPLRRKAMAAASKAAFAAGFDSVAETARMTRFVETIGTASRSAP